MEAEETEIFFNGVLNESIPPSNHEPAAYWRLSSKEPGMLERADPDPPQVNAEKELNKPKVTGCDTVLVISDDSETEEPVSNLVEPSQYPGTIIVVEQNPQWNSNKDGINVAMWIEETHPWKVVNTLQEPTQQTVELHWGSHKEDPRTLRHRDQYPQGYFSMEQSCIPKQSESSQCKLIKNVPSMPIEIEEESQWKDLKDDIEITQIIESHCILEDTSRPQQTDQTNAQFSTKVTKKEQGKPKQREEPGWNLHLDNLDIQKHIEENHQGMRPLKAPSNLELMEVVPNWDLSKEEPERPQLTEEYQNIFGEEGPGPLKSTEDLQVKMAEKRQGKLKHMAETQWMATNENPDQLKRIEDPKLHLRLEESCSLEYAEEPWRKDLNKGHESPKLTEVPHWMISQNVPGKLKLKEDSLKHVPKQETTRKKQAEESWCNKLNEQLCAPNHVGGLELKKVKESQGKPKKVEETKSNLSKEELGIPACFQEPWKKVLKQERGSPTLIAVPQLKAPENPPGTPTLKEELLNKMQKTEPGIHKETDNSEEKMYNKALATHNVADKELTLKSLMKNTNTSKKLDSPQRNMAEEELCTQHQIKEPWKKVLKKERGSPTPIEDPQRKVPQKVTEKLKQEEPLNDMIKNEPVMSRQTGQSQCKLLNGEKGTPDKTEVPNFKVHKKDTGTPKQIEDSELKIDKLTAERSEEPWRKILKQERGSPTPIEVPKQTVPQKVSGKLKKEETPQQKFIKEEPAWPVQANESEHKVFNKEIVDPKETKGPNKKVSKEEPGLQKQTEEPQMKIPKEEPGIIMRAEEVPQGTMLTEMCGLSKQVEKEFCGKVPKEEAVTSDCVQQEEHRKGACNDLDLGITHSLAKNTFKNILNKYLDPSMDYSKQPECPSGRHMYRCLACSKLFMSPSYLKSHYSMHLQQKPGECPVCKKRFIWPSRLQRHLLEHTGPWPYRCSVCQNNSADHRVVLHQDSYNHTVDKLYKCISCKLCFVNAYDLQRHKQKHHSPFSVIGFSERSQAREMGRFQCPACSRSFDSDFSLRVHKCRSNRKRLHVCSICGMQFKYPYYLARHYAIHTKVKPFQCSICLKSFRRLTHLTRHYLIHSNEQPYPSAFCSKTFLESSKLQPQPLKHTESTKEETQGAQMEMSTRGAQDPSWKREEATEVNETLKRQKDGLTEKKSEEKEAQIKNDWPLLCLACNQTFERQWDISIHKCPGTLGGEGYTEGSRKHQCAVCKKYFASPWSLNRHYRVHTKEKPFTCAECGMSFRLLSSMKQHSRTHVVNLPFSCTLCHKSFQKSSDLSEHLQGHAEEEPYRCIYCDRSFSQACSMQQHQQTHAHIHAALRATKEELPSPDLGDYQCHSCNTIYPDAKGLQEHDCPSDLSNSGDTLSRKAYECNVCEKIFKSKYDLASHFLIHTGELPFQCDQCGKRFRRLSHLKQHDVSHTVARPFQCVVCKKEFKRLADLSRHREVHNNLKSYQCGVCFKFFSRSYSLLRHQRSHDPAFVPNLGQGTLLSNSCFDSQDHSAFAQMEDEQK